MPLPKTGLRVKHCENVARYTQLHENGGLAQLVAAIPSGWFIQVRISKKWHSLMDLRFAREVDALRAAQSLTAAGLASHYALTKADPLTVKQVAVEHLQW